MLVAPHNVGGPVSTAANLHLAACTTNFKIQEHFNDFPRPSRPKSVALGIPEVVDGYFALPSGRSGRPLNSHDLIAEHPRRQIFFNLFAENWHRPGEAARTLMVYRGVFPSPDPLHRATERRRSTTPARSACSTS